LTISTPVPSNAANADPIAQARRIAVISILPGALVVAAHSFFYTVLAAIFAIKAELHLRSRVPLLEQRAIEAQVVACVAQSAGDIGLASYAHGLTRLLALTAARERTRISDNPWRFMGMPASAAALRSGIVFAITLLSLGIRVVVLGSVY
jgi:hypothetical protein